MTFVFAFYNSISSLIQNTFALSRFFFSSLQLESLHFPFHFSTITFHCPSNQSCCFSFGQSLNREDCKVPIFQLKNGSQLDCVNHAKQPSQLLRLKMSENQILYHQLTRELINSNSQIFLQSFFLVFNDINKRVFRCCSLGYSFKILPCEFFLTK